MQERIFIRNVVSVDVDGLRATNHYTVKAMYDVVGEDGFATTDCVLVDEFDYPWEQIEKDGGIAKVNADFKEVYGADCFW